MCLETIIDGNCIAIANIHKLDKSMLPKGQGHIWGKIFFVQKKA